MKVYRVEFGYNIERDDFVAKNFTAAVARATKRAQELHNKDGYPEKDVQITSLELITETDF